MGEIQMTLGSLLKKGRKERSYTAKEVIQHTGLSASASLYSQWENDLKIPTPDDLRVLCQFLNIDLPAAFNLWAAAHMPTPMLKKLFLVQAPGVDISPQTPELDPIAYPAAITQVIREQDAEWFTKNADAGTILVRCLMASNQNNKSVSAEKLAKDLGLKAPRVQTLCNELAARKYIIEQGSGFRTAPGIKYLYLPETEAFEEMRRSRIRANLDRTLNGITPKMVFDRKAARLTAFKKIPAEKVQYFVDSVEALANEMITIQDKEPEKSTYYQFICVFGQENNRG